MNAIASRISDSELEVMKVLWEAGDALTITEIRRELQARMGWEPATIKTLTQRLVNKEAIRQEKKNVFYYSANITQEEYKELATRNLVDRLFQGRAGDMVAALVRSEGITEEDLGALRKLLKKGENHE